MIDSSNREAAVDIYPGTRSGRSLRVALKTGHCFSAEDVADYAPASSTQISTLVRDLQREGHLSVVETEGFVVRVRGTVAQLEAVFDCRISAESLRPRPRLMGREVSASEYAAALNEAVSEMAVADPLKHSKHDTPFEGRWEPDPPVDLVAHFETGPRLSGCARWIDGIEAADRWPIRAERAEIVCQMMGHAWDIVLFISPFGIVECARCGARSS